MMTEDQRRQVLVDWNQTQVDYPRDRCLHDLVQEQVERRPDATAVVFGDQRLTYRQLNDKANGLARRLRDLGVGPDVLVGICVERSLEMIIGLLGILKAGGAYLPLDLEYPGDRLAFMLEEARPLALVTQRKHSGALPRHQATVVYLDALDEVDQRVGANFASEPKGQSTSLAYVIYTSGSTGKPKGVQVPHRGVTRLVLGADYARFDASRVFLQMAPISFDASTLEIWGALLHGATCVIAPPRVHAPDEIGQLVRDHRITTLWLTSALYNTIIDLNPSALSSVSELLIGGEALSPSHVRRGLTMLPNTQLINGYGPTENTTFTCCYRIPRRLERPLGPIPIGRPIANTQVYILDHRRQPVPIGVVGELYTGGDGLARGYLNSPELTAEKFIANPFSTDPASRLYRTGDLARYLPDGNIEYLGRVDHQVKIRGFRIEPGEIESVLAGHPAVRDVVVLARQDVPGDKRLTAYLTFKNGEPPTTAELRGLLRSKVPDYMVPWAFVALDQLPLTPNGKVDRQALPAPDTNRSESGGPYVAPVSSSQQALAAIWCEVLGLERVGIHDNFFELGGHSLLALRLRSRIENEVGRQLPLAAFFQAPTVHKFAQLLAEPAKPGQTSNVVTFVSEGTGAPLFLFHYLEASQRLARRLEPKRPVYGVFCSFEAEADIWDSTGQVTTSIEKLAELYILELRRVQPQGPYCLAGFCFGGLLAIEVADQLRKQGQEVGLVGLLDAFPLPQVTPHLAPNWLRRAVYHVRQAMTHGPSYISVRVRGVFRRRVLQRSNWRHVRFMIEIMRRYRIKPYNGQVVLFRAWPGFDTPQDGWGGLLFENLHLEDIQCSHNELSSEPHVSEVAKKFEKYLTARDSPHAEIELFISANVLEMSSASSCHTGQPKASRESR
jgi:aspartate racemase